MFPKPLWWAVWIVVFLAAACNSATKDQKAEGCFLYPVNETLESPQYDFRDIDENYVTIKHIFGASGYTQVMNERNECIVGLKHHKSTVTEGKCNATFSLLHKESTTLVFRKRGNTLGVKTMDSMDNEFSLQVTPRTLWINSTEQINVGFDCPGNCYQFQNAFIHKHYPKNVTIDSLRIYGKLENATEAKDSSIIIKRFGNSTESGQKSIPLHEWKLDSVAANQWFPIDIKPSFGPFYDMSPYGFQSMTVSGEVFSSQKASVSNFTAKDVNAPTRDLYLDFGQTSGIRWAAFCQPKDDVSSPSTTGFSKVQIGLILFFLLAFVFISVVVCIIICNQRKLIQQGVQATSNQALVQDVRFTNANVIENNVVSGEERIEEEEHEYDYIDLTILQQQLEKDRDITEHEVPAEIPPEGRWNDHAGIRRGSEEMGRSGSHTSINSLYGYTENKNS